jgi:hypothetical protein
MPKEILEYLFDSPVKLKILKLFFRHPEEAFELKEVIKRTKANSSACSAQIKKLESIKLLKNRLRKNRKVYAINSDFDFYPELKTLVLKSSPASKEKILKRLKSLSQIKLVVLSGVFTNTENSRVDLLIVGDRIDSDKNKKLSNFFKELESEVGREIDYVVLSTKDFKYRYGMFDRFIRDILEKPHEKLINRLRI